PNSLQGNYRILGEDSAGDVFDLDTEHPVGVYQADSTIRIPASTSLRLPSTSVVPEVLSIYLQLPALDPRVEALAEQITARATTSLDKAAAMKNYSPSHYGYTLQLPSTAVADPIANFLFVRRQGHCEYFASSMAVMLRSLRIPSRVVNGF